MAEMDDESKSFQQACAMTGVACGGKVDHRRVRSRCSKVWQSKKAGRFLRVVSAESGPQGRRVRSSEMGGTIYEGDNGSCLVMGIGHRARRHAGTGSRRADVRNLNETEQLFNVIQIQANLLSVPCHIASEVEHSSEVLPLNVIQA